MKMNTQSRMFPQWKTLSPEEEFQEESFYSKRIRTLLVEDGALRPEEEGFMSGYDDGLIMDDPAMEDMME
jgi:hypothetical protein